MLHTHHHLAGLPKPCRHSPSHKLKCVVVQAAGGPGKGSRGSQSGSNKDSKRSSGKASSGGFSGSKKGGGSNQGKAGGGGGQAKKASAPQRSYVSSSVQVELQDELTPTEFAETPRWDTWSNHVSGEWVGVYGAYTPWAGLPEPVWLDPRGKYMHTVLTRCLEERGRGVAGGAKEVGEEEDLLLRKLARANTPAELKNVVINPSQPSKTAAQSASTTSPSLPLPADPTQAEAMEAEPPLEGSAEAAEGDKEEEEAYEVEALTYNSQGVVVFDGGHYSAGPDYIGPPAFKVLQEDDGEDGEGEGETVDAPTTTSIVETCLVDWSTRTRMRLKLTLRIGHNPDNDEVEVEVLRILLFREAWAGPPGLTQPDDIESALLTLAGHPAGTAPPVNGVSNPEIESALENAELLPRVDPRTWNSDWNVFTVSATSIEEADLLTGEPQVVWVYMTNEDKQTWQVPAGMPTGDAGGAVWLPGGVVCSFSMVDYSEQGGDSDEDEEAAGSSGSNGATPAAGRPPRGLRLGMSWSLPVGNQVVFVERDYDGAGVLRGVRYSTAVKGGWSGGRM